MHVLELMHTHSGTMFAYMATQTLLRVRKLLVGLSVGGHVCVCVCVWWWGGDVCVCVTVCVRTCMCARV